MIFYIWCYYSLQQELYFLMRYYRSNSRPLLEIFTQSTPQGHNSPSGQLTQCTKLMPQTNKQSSCSLFFMNSKLDWLDLTNTWKDWKKRQQKKQNCKNKWLKKENTEKNSLKKYTEKGKDWKKKMKDWKKKRLKKKEQKNGHKFQPSMKQKMFYQLTLFILFPAMCFLTLTKLCHSCKFNQNGLSLKVNTKFVRYKAQNSK